LIKNLAGMALLQGRHARDGILEDTKNRS